MANNRLAIFRPVFRSLLIPGSILLASHLALSQGVAPVVPGSVTYSPGMTFDVASVRESDPDPIKGFMIGGGFVGHTSLLRLSNVKVIDMLDKAYGLSSHSISGLPGWTSNVMFNVEAKSDDATDKRMATLTEEQVVLEQQHMLQALLAERFNLKAHWSTKELPIFDLVLSRGGPKVRPGGSLPRSEDDRKRFGSDKVPEVFQRGDGTHGYELVARDCHIASLARMLGNLMGTDVTDRTGLSSTYDFDLRYSQASDAERDKDPKMFPPLPDAIADQLGLKLERAKGEVRELVVDHIDKQSEN